MNQDDMPVDEADDIWDNGEHVWHHSQPPEPHVSVSAEKNSKGWTWSVSVSGAESVEQAMAMLNSMYLPMSVCQDAAFGNLPSWSSVYL